MVQPYRSLREKEIKKYLFGESKEMFFVNLHVFQMAEWRTTWVNKYSCLLKPMLSFTRVVDKWQRIKLEVNSLETLGHPNILAKQEEKEIDLHFL